MYEDLRTYLVSLEISLLDARARNPTKVADFLDADYQELGSTGTMYTRAEVLGALINREGPTPSIKAQDFQVREFVPGVLLVTYHAIHDGTPEVHTMRSSIWQLWGGKWKLTFHQGTRITP
ncbi:MAG TPA: DUF4440 domain-containing protein [Methylophilaceae bacterium]|jgi:hypothetical protein